MNQASMTKEERNILLGVLVVTVLIELALMFGLGYFLLSMQFKTEYLFDADKFMIFVYPAAFLIIILIQIPKIVFVFQDVSSQIVVEGIGAITEDGISGYNVFDKFIRIDSFGKDKIRIQGQFKDKSSLSSGNKVKFRVAPQSKMLIAFSKA